MNRIITYCINDDGIVYSRVGSDMAFPVLDFDAIGKGGDGFEPGDFNGPMRYALEKCSVFDFRSEWSELKWTKKIPVSLKNRHRTFWGFKPLPATEATT